MRALIQRVTSASVAIDGITVGKIGKGLLILLGVSGNDTCAEADKLVEKMLKSRIFEDENGKMNLSVTDIRGECLVVSQFTLYADCRRGNRPDFMDAARPDKANELYEYFKKKLNESGLKVECGVFGADMKVSLCNDGPVTIMLDTDELKKSRKS